MAVSSYNAIGSVTLSSAQTQVTISNIPQIYTDLVLVTSVKLSGTPGTDVIMRFNGDSSGVDNTSGKYSATIMYGNGSGTGSPRLSNRTGMYTDYYGAPDATNYDVNTINIINYSNSTTYKTAIMKAKSTIGVDAIVGMWRSTAAINSITLGFYTSVSFAAGTTFNLYGVGANTLKASGGDVIVSDGTYWYHAFTSSGTFTPNSTLSCDVLVVAGGGAGGSSQSGAAYQATGGGAGGLFYSSGNSISTAKTVTVGAGGVSSGQVYPFRGTNGSNSTFQGITAAVGGGGGIYYGAEGQGLNGGSGSGGSGQHNTPTPGLGTSGQGNNGGVGVYAAGGGGGAGGVGGNSGWPDSVQQAGVGGAGSNTYSAWLNSTNTGVNGFIAGGGGGGFSDGYGTPSNYNNGSSGGGGKGGSGGIGSPVGAGSQLAVAGVTNTGSGGGGGGANTNTAFSGGFNGANGGSGLIIVRYAV